MRGAGARPAQRVDLSEHHLVEVPVGARDPEIVAAELWAAGATAIEERLGLLLAGFADRDRARHAAAVHGATMQTLTEEELLDRQRGLGPVVVAGPFCVHPPQHRPPDGLLGIRIDPGHTFGTASHPSTRLALELLADVVTADTHVADIGCGSGVLTVAAALLGGHVEAVDPDPAAIAATASNVAANEVSDRVRVAEGSVGDLAGPVDVAVANVTIDIHETLAPAILERRPAMVIVAGILDRQVARALACYPCRATRRRTDGEWVGLRLDL